MVALAPRSYARLPPGEELTTGAEGSASHAGVATYDPLELSLLLDTADDLGIAINNLALQKLLYFAHGHSLIQTGVPLVQGAFEAWNNGPVHPAVYHAFKSAGRDPIRTRTRASGRNVMTGEAKPRANPQSPDVRRDLQRHARVLRPPVSGLLVAISHAPKGPW